ncbi:hypothetical protein ACC817_34535 [Rhizobium ruizarguesonis]|uniref:hypothetical protein n=1 Tax=Rhizobium ruizarguesonis TaxID=2081791 RepID=UPI0010305F9E|nr:hypothetical protein [Rhizobium ruizarguesonis]TAY73870.1 hypothetical protein ELH84_08225 [Rhizobium ruizarguesonis]
MDEAKNYLKTDEIQADDQLSPKPIEGKDPPRRVRRSEEAIAEGSDETERVRVPPPVPNPIDQPHGSVSTWLRLPASPHLSAPRS